jgi:hypothetical protein
MFKEAFKLVLGVGLALFVLLLLAILASCLGIVGAKGGQETRNELYQSIVGEKKPDIGPNQYINDETCAVVSFDSAKYISENKMVTVYVVHGVGLSDDVNQYSTLDQCQEFVRVIGGRCVRKVVVE